MARIAAVLALVSAGAALAASDALAQEKTAPTAHQGILVDLRCYSMDPANWVEDHMTPKGKMPMCATTCAKMGIPVGLLVGGKPGGKVMVIITPTSALADHMTKEVRITGQVVLDGSGVLPDKIEVQDKGKWKELKIATMM
jgi:hypothetical protein